MKKALALFLVFALLLSGCSSATPKQAEVVEKPEPTLEAAKQTDAPVSPAPVAVDYHYLEDNPEEIVEGDSKSKPREVSFANLNDPDLIDYVEQNVYSELSAQLGPDYHVENVSATYISKEYLEEVAYIVELDPRLKRP